MRFLAGAKSVASSFLSSWKKTEVAGLVTAKHVSSKPILWATRSETQQILTMRKREFDKLRALRQKVILNHEKPEQAFFHTNIPTNLSTKTSTIKKIDEIEVQMSMQWWKTDRLDLNLQDDSKKRY